MRNDLRSSLELVKREWAFFLLIFSLYAGQGISYGPLCLFHLVVPVYAIRELFLGFKFSNFLAADVLPFHGIILWVFVSSFISGYELNYLYYYSFGYAVFLLLWMKKELVRTEFRAILLFCALLLSIDLVIGFMEFTTLFRYPISKLSNINHLFGRNYSVFESGTECFDLSYVLSSPTGFHWNQNNYALVLLLGLPLSGYINHALFRNVLRTIGLLLILATGSRLGFTVAALIVMALVISEMRSTKTGLIPFLFLLVVFTDGLYVFPLGSKKVKEVALVSKSVFSDRFPDHCYQHQGSTDSRKQLVLSGLEIFSKHPILGSGAGGFTRNMMNRNKSVDSAQRTSLNAHNYILELLVDFGIVILFPMLWIFWNLYKGYKRSDRRKRLTIILFCFALLTGTIMISSWVYFVVAYASFFLCYIVLTDIHTEQTALPEQD